MQDRLKLFIKDLKFDIDLQFFDGHSEDNNIGATIAGTLTPKKREMYCNFGSLKCRCRQAFNRNYFA